MKQGRKKGVHMINNIKALQRSGHSISRIARMLKTTRVTVRKYLASDSPRVPKVSKPYEAPWSSKINWPHVKSETARGVALSHYWEENVGDKTEISYLSFWREYKRRYPEIPIDMHKTYSPGLRCEIDFKGKDKGFGFTDPVTGKFVSCRLFGSILCFSQLFFCRATHDEKQESLLESLSKSYQYFGGVPETTIFDNAKAQVTKAHRYDPDLNPEFSFFCEAYGTAPIATRPMRPKDKNLIENALGVFWRWSWPKLSKRTYSSLGDLNSALLALVKEFNNRIQKKYGVSRHERFVAHEKDRLKALPESSYSHGEWSMHKAHADCHIQCRYNFYSVPYQYRGKELDVRVSGGIIEVYYKLKRIAIHSKLSVLHKGSYITDKKHLPEAHKAILEMTPQNLIAQAGSIGPNTCQVIERLIYEANFPLTYLRRCQGILRLKRRFDAPRLEKACVFFKERGLSEIRVSNIERVIQSNARQVSSGKRSHRKNNENLRGQHSVSNF